MPQPEAQPEEEGLLANDNVQEPEPALAPNVVPQPRTLLGRISFVALSFFASLIPGQPLPDYGLLQ